MKALILESYNNLIYKDFPDPEIQPDEVLVEVKACGICGSDVHGMDGSTGRRIPPVIMGHEASGVIVSTGPLVKNWKAGDRITFDSTIYPLDDWYTLKGQYNLSDNRKVLGVSAPDFRQHGAFAEYVAVPSYILHRLPDDVTFIQAAMVEPVAVAAHAVSLALMKINDTVLVAGTGMIGLFIIHLLKTAGAGKIIAVDIDDKKLEMAKKYGATHLINPQKDSVQDLILSASMGSGADISFEVAGISQTVNIAIHGVRKGGSVILVGNLSPEVTLPLQAVVTRQIKLQGSCAICGEYPLVLDLISNGIINVDEMISAVAPLSEGAEWFKRLYNKEPGLNKVILVP